MSNRYEVTFRRSDMDTVSRRYFDHKESALAFARYMQFKVNDLYIGGVTASHVELWAIVETRHNITEAIFLDDVASGTKGHSAETGG